MNLEDPSDRYLNENLQFIAESPERAYFHDEKNKLLVASWKNDRADHIAPEAFQQNAIMFADLIAKRRPDNIMVDCRHLGHQLTDEQQHWYVQKTRALWLKSSIKKMAFVFKSNLAVQLGMEGLKEVAQGEGIPSFNYRIFETPEEAISWMKSGS